MEKFEDKLDEDLLVDIPLIIPNFDDLDLADNQIAPVAYEEPKEKNVIIQSELDLEKDKKGYEASPEQKKFKQYGESVIDYDKIATLAKQIQQ